jgi:hypothetical protein
MVPMDFSRQLAVSNGVDVELRFFGDSALCTSRNKVYKRKRNILRTLLFWWPALLLADFLAQTSSHFELASHSWDGDLRRSSGHEPRARSSSAVARSVHTIFMQWNVVEMSVDRPHPGRLRQLNSHQTVSAIESNFIRHIKPFPKCLAQHPRV